MAFALPLGVSACVQDMDIRVTSVRGVVEFAMPAMTPPCIRDVTVYAASDRTNPVWLIDSDDRQTCVTRFRYGIAPAGFTQRGAAVPLRTGTLYLVSAGRPGGRGITFFEPGRDGSIERDAPEH